MVAKRDEESGSIVNRKKQTTLSLDAETVERAKPICRELGLSLSNAVEMFLRAMVREKGLPIDAHINPTPRPRVEYAFVPYPTDEIDFSEDE